MCCYNGLVGANVSYIMARTDLWSEHIFKVYQHAWHTENSVKRATLPFILL